MRFFRLYVTVVCREHTITQFPLLKIPTSTSSGISYTSQSDKVHYPSSGLHVIYFGIRTPHTVHSQQTHIKA